VVPGKRPEHTKASSGLAPEMYRREFAQSSDPWTVRAKPFGLSEDRALETPARPNSIKLQWLPLAEGGIPVVGARSIGEATSSLSSYFDSWFTPFTQTYRLQFEAWRSLIPQS
jgi:hypothetical protein